MANFPFVSPRCSAPSLGLLPPFRSTLPPLSLFKNPYRKSHQLVQHQFPLNQAFTHCPKVFKHQVTVITFLTPRTDFETRRHSQSEHAWNLQCDGVLPLTHTASRFLLCAPAGPGSAQRFTHTRYCCYTLFTFDKDCCPIRRSCSSLPSVR